MKGLLALFIVIGAQQSMAYYDESYTYNNDQSSSRKCQIDQRITNKLIPITDRESAGQWCTGGGGYCKQSGVVKSFAAYDLTKNTVEISWSEAESSGYSEAETYYSHSAPNRYDVRGSDDCGDVYLEVALFMPSDVDPQRIGDMAITKEYAATLVKEFKDEVHSICKVAKARPVFIDNSTSVSPFHPKNFIHGRSKVLNIIGRCQF